MSQVEVAQQERLLVSPAAPPAAPPPVAEEPVNEEPVDAVDDRPEYVQRPLRARNTAAPQAAAYCRNVRRYIRAEEKLAMDCRSGLVTFTDEGRIALTEQLYNKWQEILEEDNLDHWVRGCPYDSVRARMWLLKWRSRFGVRLGEGPLTSRQRARRARLTLY